jgi:hypothetical protein
MALYWLLDSGVGSYTIKGIKSLKQLIDKIRFYIGKDHFSINNVHALTVLYSCQIGD